MKKVNNNKNCGTPAKDSGKVAGKENRKISKKESKKTKMERGDKEEKKGFGFA